MCLSGCVGLTEALCVCVDVWDSDKCCVFVWMCGTQTSDECLSGCVGLRKVLCVFLGCVGLRQVMSVCLDVRDSGKCCVFV